MAMSEENLETIRAPRLRVPGENYLEDQQGDALEEAGLSV